MQHDQTLSARERAGLADDLDRLGPDAPTVLPGWDAHDMLLHLLLREGAPQLIGLAHVPGPIGAWGRSRIEHLDELPWSERVERFRSGPPALSPLRWMDSFANTSENLIHHEDLLRAQPGWEPRTFSADDQSEIFGILRRMAPMLVRTPVSLLLVSSFGGIRLGARHADTGSVRVHGDPLELLLWAFGRDCAQVRIDGSEFAKRALSQGRRGF